MKPDSLSVMSRNPVSGYAATESSRWVRRKKSAVGKIGHSSEYSARIHFDFTWQKSNWNTFTQRAEFMGYLPGLEKSQSVSSSQK